MAILLVKWPVNPNILAASVPVGNLRSFFLLPSVWWILFECLIFNCYKIRICEKEKVKDETSKKIRETNVCLIVTTSAFVKKETSKICEANGSQMKEQDVPLTLDSSQVCNTFIWNNKLIFYKARMPHNLWRKYWISGHSERLRCALVLTCSPRQYQTMIWDSKYSLRF